MQSSLDVPSLQPFETVQDLTCGKIFTTGFENTDGESLFLAHMCEHKMQKRGNQHRKVISPAKSLDLVSHPYILDWRECLQRFLVNY